MDEPGASWNAGHLRWVGDEPPHQVRASVLVAAFAGWNDAGEAATAAVRTLNEAWSARPLATIDPEEFYDFTSTRPIVHFDDAMQRRVRWPENSFSLARVPGSSLDVITLVGVEPELRWRTFCAQVTGLALGAGCRMLITLGALLAEVPHTRPVSVFGTGHDDRTITELDLLPSRYEGPTGITGVLGTAARDAGLRAVSFWAAVPTYVPSAPSPKAALALVERTTALLDVRADVDALVAASATYEREVSEVAAADEGAGEYLRALESRYDEGGLEVLDDPDRLVEEVERFLRDQD